MRRGIPVVAAATPMKARLTLPCRAISPATKWAVLEATAKQMPCAPAMTAVLTPMTSPAEETSGPPELPGLSAASVCTTSSIIRPAPDCSVRPSAEMTPVVTVASKPSGLPIAIAICPRFSFEELPSFAAGRAALESMRNSARSVSGSSPSTLAERRRPSSVVTSTRLAL